MKFLKCLSLSASVMAVLASCAHKPTQVFTNQKGPQKITVPAADDIVIGENTVIIDARSAFDYATAHHPRALNLTWDSMSEPGSQLKGALQSDLFALARRLSRLGVDPNTPVLVLGYGRAGHGEEGRVTWVLRYLGVKNVRFVDQDVYKGRLDALAIEAPVKPPKAKPIWQPNLQQSWIVGREELNQVINSRQTVPKSKNEAAEVAIIDVRSAREYLGKEGLALQKSIPNMGAVNIDWREFLNENGNARAEIKLQLQKIGILPSQRIIVVSAKGVRSGLVTVVLQELGFLKAGNFVDGLESL